MEDPETRKAAAGNGANRKVETIIGEVQPTPNADADQGETALTAAMRRARLRRCPICHTPSASFEIDWWDECGYARKPVPLHPECEKAFFAKLGRYRTPPGEMAS
jgi:hypothetical protein